jgi:hemerythrin
MPLIWNANLAVGVKKIDDEHQELFGRINKLLEAMAQARAKEEVEPLFAFLGSYVANHFGGEERLMKAHGYPGTAEHLGQHAFFNAELSALVAEFRKGGANATLTIKLNKLLCDWFRDHVAKLDKQLGAHLAKAGAASAV